MTAAAVTTETPPDFCVENHGSIFLLCPTSDRGRAWIEDHLDEPTWFGSRGVAVEHRFIGDIVAGIVDDDLGVI